MAESLLPPFPGATDGLWDARSPRIPFVEPSAPEASDPRPTRSYVLDFSTGESVTVTGSGLIGRSPRSVADDSSLQLVGIDDPGRSVSKVHVRFDTDSQCLWIEDLDSANGTAIEGQSGPAVSIGPGRRHPVEPGAVVRIGRQSFTVR